jgi:nucleoside-diphosphate-sugar epimerase
MSRVLVTGGAGFIGRQLVSHLIERGDRVVCLVRCATRAASLADLGAEIVVGDVTDVASLRTAVADTQTVYHLAGAVMVIDRQDFYRINAEGAGNIARVCADQPKPPVLVFASSLAAAGISPGDDARTEEQPEEPVSVYGKSKLAAEQRLREFAGEVPITIVRPPIVFGPGDKHLLRAFRSIKNGWHVSPSSAGSHFSLVYVQDLAEMLVKAADDGRRIVPESEMGADHSTGIYFAASPEQPTYSELGARMAAAMGKKRFRSVDLPRPLCFAVSGVVEVLMRFEGRARLLNLDKMREATAGNWICSAARAARELGFRPKRSLDERLQETARWYSAHAGL